ncbi:lipopolysaccharide biosynthesis protein [Leptothrix discophora]|uniref:Polysaccharide biosynthesis protein n=1 Tax=Leptothrix discophora TaxID=89 RepID=A0ABT9FXY3_LEPDI|nr:hypothetical protein [Leptothrix discophora]MDP4299061.1 hypothetical protein [Leptothrix discophora]
MKIVSHKNRSIYAIADQIILSLLGLGASIVVARFAGKEQFGLYTLLFSIVLLVQGIQNSMWYSPLIALLARTADLELKNKYRMTAFKGSIGSMVILILLMAAGFLLLGNEKIIHGDPPSVIFAVSLASIGATLRDGLRAESYADGSSFSALKYTLIAASIQLTLILFVTMFGLMSANAVLTISGASLILSWMILSREKTPLLRASADYREFIEFSRWTLPSVGVNWAGGNIQNYFAARNFGLSVVAEVNAARLFLMPVGVAVTAWVNYFRPSVIRERASGNTLKARLIIKKSILIAVFLIPVYGVVIGSLSPVFSVVLGDEYPELRSLIFGWAVCFSLMAIRVIIFTELSADKQGVKLQFYFGLIGFCCAVLSMMAFLELGAVGVVISMCCLEVVQIILFLAYGRNRS